MRLGILIKDAEYRAALVEKLSSYDKNIYVNIMGGSVGSASGSLIITDINPDEIEKSVLDAIRQRTVFLTESDAEIHDGCHRVFKYESVTSIISELSLVYKEWHGEGPGHNCRARLISVCCETDAYSADKCSALARQIIYRRGGSVLILPLSYINDYGINDNSCNKLSKLLYLLRTGRERKSDSFTYADSYGISTLILPHGRNPLAYLDADELANLTYGLASRFDTVIFDMGTCLRNENLSIMKNSDHIIWFGTGRRTSGIDGIAWVEEPGKLVRIRLTGEADEAIAIDDCIKQIYNCNKDDDNNSSSDKKIR